MPAEAGEERQREPSPLAQLAEVELPPRLEPDDEEEERHQARCSPTPRSSATPDPPTGSTASSTRPSRTRRRRRSPRRAPPPWPRAAPPRRRSRCAGTPAAASGCFAPRPSAGEPRRLWLVDHATSSRMLGIMDADRARRLLEVERERIERALGRVGPEDDGEPADEFDPANQARTSIRTSSTRESRMTCAPSSLRSSGRSSVSQPAPTGCRSQAASRFRRAALEALPTAELTSGERRTSPLLARARVADAGGQRPSPMTRALGTGGGLPSRRLFRVSRQRCGRPAGTGRSGD